MLHVWIFPVWLEGTHTERRYRSGCGYCYSGWDGLIESRRSGDRSGAAGKRANGEILLIRRVRAYVLFVGPIQDLIIVNAVTGANRSRALAKWIPSDPKARTKITFRSFHYSLPIWRRRRHAAIGG